MEKKMNPVNKLLSLFGMQLARINNSHHVDNDEKAFKQDYEKYIKLAETSNRGFNVLRKYRYEAGNHPVEIHHLDCGFAARHLGELNPGSVLEIGSFRLFILGLLAHYRVTTLDIRQRLSDLPNEEVVVCDAKSLEFPDESYGAVLSLGALPHFGLCRYGDEFDLDGDIKALNEMVRVLRPGGYLIFSAAITRSDPTILFNAERVYSYGMIKELCGSLTRIEDKFINRRKRTFCDFNDVSKDPYLFDYYVGCWKKEAVK